MLHEFLPPLQLWHQCESCSIRNGDLADGINAVVVAPANSKMYNLNGQAVGADYKGIVIMNGKKMFNK